MAGGSDRESAAGRAHVHAVPDPDRQVGDRVVDHVAKESSEQVARVESLMTTNPDLEQGQRLQQVREDRINLAGAEVRERRDRRQLESQGPESGAQVRGGDVLEVVDDRPEESVGILAATLGHGDQSVDPPVTSPDAS